MFSGSVSVRTLKIVMNIFKYLIDIIHQDLTNLLRKIVTFVRCHPFSIFFEHPFDHPRTGWWFGTWLLFSIYWELETLDNNHFFSGLVNITGGLQHEIYDFPSVGNFIIPTDELSIIFQRGRYTTNHITYRWLPGKVPL